MTRAGSRPHDPPAGLGLATAADQLDLVVRSTTYAVTPAPADAKGRKDKTKADTNELPGRARLALARVYVGSIDAVLTDLRLPGNNGRDLAEQLLLLRPKLRVLFMSGYADVQPDAGETRILAKPFTALALIDAVQTALDATPAR